MSKQQYICINKTCKMNDSGASWSEAGNCVLCQEPLVARKEELVLTEDEKEIINKYPSVIALKFYEFISDNEDSAMDKVTLLKDTYEISLRYLALLVISEYFNSELKNRDFNIWINKFYQDTSVGTVETFLELSIPLLHKLNHSFFISELLNFHKLVFPSIDNNHKVKNYKIIRLENIDSESIKENIFEGSLLTCLRQEFRNNYFGHGFKWTTEVCSNIIDIFKPLLIDFLIIIDFTKNYTLTNKHDEKCFEQKGFKTPKQVTCNYDFPNDSVWVTDKNSKKPFELAPFFIQLSADKNTSKILHYFFDYPSKTRIRYRNIHSEVTVTDKTLHAIEQLKKKKAVKVKLYDSENISRKILSNTANNYSKNVIKELNDEGIYIKSVNQPREDILLSLKEWLGAKFGLFFISSKAGLGKTNLMINLRSEYIGYFQKFYKKNRNDILLLRSVKMLHDSFEVILGETLNLKPNFDFNCFHSKLGFTQADPFIILVDAGNEHEQPLRFLNSILNFIKKYKGGYIKIVLTWRADLKNELPKVSKSYAPFIYSEEVYTKQENILAQKTFVLEPFNHNELAKAWDNYTNTKDNLFNPKFSFEDIIFFDKNLVEELKNPQYLRLFLEYFNRKELPKTKGLFNFWANWSLQFKDGSEEFELLMALAEVMFECETDRLPFDIYYEHPKLIEYIRDDANGPFERLKTKKVITQFHLDGSRYLLITLEAFYHYLLGEILFEKFKSKPNNELLELLKTSELKGVKEGIQFLLIKDIHINNLDRLSWLVDNSNEELLQWYVFPLAESFIRNEVKDVFKNLFNIQTINDTALLLKTVIFLEENYKHRLLKIIFLKINEYIKINSYESICLYIKGLTYFIPKERNSIIKDIKKALKVVSLSEYDLETIFSNIAGYFDELREFERSHEFNLLSLQISKSLYSKNDSELYSAYNNLGLSYLNMGNVKKALKYFNKCVSYFEKNQVDQVLEAAVYNNMAMTYRHSEKYQEAFDFYNMSLKIIKKSKGETNLDAAQVFNNLGVVCSLQLKLDEALIWHKSSLKTRLRILFDNHPNLISSYANLGITYKKRQEYEKSIKFFKLWWENTNEKTGAQAYEIYTCHKELNQPKEAIYWLEQTALLRKERLGEEDERTINTFKELRDYAKEINDNDILKKWSSNNLN